MLLLSSLSSTKAAVHFVKTLMAYINAWLKTKNLEYSISYLVWWVGVVGLDSRGICSCKFIYSISNVQGPSNELDWF